MKPPPTTHGTPSPLVLQMSNQVIYSGSSCRAAEMNLSLRPADLPLTTQAAEGLPRRRFTVAEIEAAVRAGVIEEDERFELIGGEIVPMSPKGAVHEWIKILLNEHFQRVRPDHLLVAQETTLRLDATTFVGPDFCVFRRDLPLTKLDGPAVVLAVEVADSSLAYDRGRKISVYAAFGVREVWVIDARRVVTRVHRHLGAEGYVDVFDEPATAPLIPTLAPELAARLADLGVTRAGEA